MQLYYGPSMIFLHMQIFQVGVLKRNFLVLFVIRIVLHFDYKADGNGVTWVIVNFCRLIIDFDVIKSLLMEMKTIEQHLNNCLGKMFYINQMEWNTLLQGRHQKIRCQQKEKENMLNLSTIGKKKNIFFQLVYWKTLILHHNLDVMHIEKNICDSIVGTLLRIDGKSKDNFNSRLNLLAMGIRAQLHSI